MLESSSLRQSMQQPGESPEGSDCGTGSVFPSEIAIRCWSEPRPAEGGVARTLSPIRPDGTTNSCYRKRVCKKIKRKVAEKNNYSVERRKNDEGQAKWVTWLAATRSRGAVLRSPALSCAVARLTGCSGPLLAQGDTVAGGVVAHPGHVALHQVQTPAARPVHVFVRQRIGDLARIKSRPLILNLGQQTIRADLIAEPRPACWDRNRARA